MRELMSDHALQLGAVELGEQPTGHGHRGVLGVATGGEGIGGAVLDDVDLRLGDASADDELLDDMMQLRLLLLRDLVCLGHAEHDLVAGEV